MADELQAVITKMRADFVLVAESRRASGDWSAQDEKEIGDAIKAAIASKDRRAAVACWSRWLADLSAWVTAWNLICRGSEIKMRDAARAHSTEQKEQGKQ